jgi:hypothetical protein
MLDAGREDADDGPALRVEAERASDDGGIGVEAAAPETIAQDDDAVIGPHVILVKEAAPDGGDAECREEFGGDLHRGEAFRAAIAGSAAARCRAA